MKTKLFIVTLAATLLAGGAVSAQNDQQEEIDALKRKIAELTESVTDTRNEVRFQQVWKRGRYFNIGYVMQTRDLSGYDLPDYLDLSKTKSSVGASISWGKQFYLHSKPIANMIKFAIDWTWFDANYVQYKIPEGESVVADGPDSEIINKYHQADVAMQLGGSMTVNPVDHLKASVYFRVSPTYSFITGGLGGSGYGTFCNFGISVAYKVASIGYEYRWGSINSKYTEQRADGTDITPGDKFKSKIATSRIYFGFRF